MPSAATKWIPKSRICKTTPKNERILGAIAWGEAPVRPSVPRLGAPPGMITPGAATKWVPTGTIFFLSV